MVPGADEHFARRCHVLRRPERGVAVAVAPAADEQRRGLDLVVAAPNAAVPPVITVLLIGQPGEQVRVVLLQALLPKLGPTGRRCTRGRAALRSCLPWSCRMRLCRSSSAKPRHGSDSRPYTGRR